MKVQDVMNREPHAVRIVDRLDEAARIMWEQDCGFVPVVDGTNTLVGVVTDRDLCMASYMQAAPIASIPVVAVMVPEPVTCGPQDTLVAAMETLAQQQVHRLPVVDSQGVLLGVLSTNDVMQVAEAQPKVVTAANALATLAAISKPRSGARNFASSEKIVSVKAASASKVVPSAARVVAPKKPAAKAVAKPVTKAGANSATKLTTKLPTKLTTKPQPKKVAAKAPAKTSAKPVNASKGRATKGRAKA
ncbi:MAG: CBS domain-containing protein [Planctomycetota bacterium]|jgi:CBS domain-containing protein